MRRPSTLMGLGASVTMSISARKLQFTPPISSLPRFFGSAPVINPPSRGPCSTTDAPSTARVSRAKRPTTPYPMTLPARSRDTSPTNVPLLAPRLQTGLMSDPNPTTSSGAPAAAAAVKPTLYIIDALNFIFRAFHALPPLTSQKGVPTGAVYGRCQMLLRIERENRPTHLCAVFDAPGENFRHTLYPQYKSHRPPMPPELAAQMGWVHPVIDAFGIQVLTVPGFEADDVIATVARTAVAMTSS